MKAYRYSAEECGRNDWPQGLLQLEGAEIVNNPNEADVFISPVSAASYGCNADGEFLSIDHAIHGMRRLTYMNAFEDRHVFMDVNDHFKFPVRMRSMFIRCDQRATWWEADPNAIPFAWPVRDFSECVDVPGGHFTSDVSFHGWLSTDTRSLSSQSCLDTAGLKCDIARYDGFTGYLDTPTHPEYDPVEFEKRNQNFRRSMRESRVALCPESIIGVLPYRFFEAMSAGRVPILVSSNYVLPFDNELPYDEFIVRIPADQASRAGEIIQEFLRRTPDDQLIRMGQKARAAWLDRLNAEHWPALWAYAVKKQLAKITCVSSS